MSKNEYAYTEGVIEGEPTKTYAYTYTNAWKDQLTNYYNYVSDGESELTTDKYRETYLNRWDRLDYTRQEVRTEKYELNELRYYGEYSFHMFAWYLTGWSLNKNIPLISGIAGSAKDACVLPNEWESEEDWWRNIFYLLCAALGI